MKLNMTVHSLNDVSDHVEVTAQGYAQGDADWQPWRSIMMRVPAHIGNKYTLGQSLVITVKPGKK